MYEHLQKLLRYGRWADQIVADLLSTTPPLEDAATLFEHVLVAQDTWIRRILGEPSIVNLWPRPAQQTWQARISGHFDRLSSVLDQHREQLGVRVTYSTSKGATYSTSLQDIIAHLAIHGQHHRAQIARIVREQGGVPPALDYIHFVRLQE